MSNMVQELPARNHCGIHPVKRANMSPIETGPKPMMVEEVSGDIYGTYTQGDVQDMLNSLFLEAMRNLVLRGLPDKFRIVKGVHINGVRAIVSREQVKSVVRMKVEVWA